MVSLYGLEGLGLRVKVRVSGLWFRVASMKC